MTRKSRLKWVWRGLGGLAVLLIVALAGGFLWLRTSLPRLSGEQQVAGLTAAVTVARDGDGVPHIRAETAADAYFALGFVHAQDRLFQMDFTRRLGTGRLSELVGMPTIALDRTMRTLGLHRLAAASLAMLSDDARAALAAYAKGVNAYLDTHPGALPPEFYALGYSPEPWRETDSLVWGRLMGLRLSGNWRTEALRGALAGRLAPDRIEQLWPGDDGRAPPTVSAAARPAALSRMFAGLVDAFPDALRPITASNSWGVAGSRTRSGRPILANDPHLGFGAPILWYLARIEAPGLDLTGATVPGVPFTLLGHNRSIAWAFTTTESDTQDLFIERVDPDDPGRYLTPDGSRPFSVRRETIRVAGAEDIVFDVRATRHGPVVSDIDPSLAARAGNGHVIALAATTLRDDDRTAEALFRLNRAHDWAGFRAAMRKFDSPHQNVTYADTAGNLGFIAPARVPVRRGGNGLDPAPGWTGSHDWTGFIPFDELPQTLNPGAGRIVSANHRVAPKGYPHYLGEGRTPSYRAQRIHRLLDAAGRHSPEASTAMHQDTVSLMARDLLPLLTGVTPSDARARQAVTALRGWDGTMDRTRREPLIFIAWLRELNRLVYADELGPLFGRFWSLRPRFIRAALTRNQEWCDDVATAARETCGARIETALNRALDELSVRFGDDPAGWRWGDAHYAKFSHPLFGRIPVLKWLADSEVPSGGGAFTVNRADHRVSNSAEPFASIHGPGFRAVYDLSDLDNSRFMMATGQSGNPLSPHYGDLNDRWRDGDYIRIGGGPRGAGGNARVLRLVPRR